MKLNILDYAVEELKKQVLEIIEKESVDPNFLNMKDYETMTARIKDGFDPAFKSFTQKFVVKAIQHYEEDPKHDNVYQEEYNATTAEMGETETQMVLETQAEWWSN